MPFYDQPCLRVDASNVSSAFLGAAPRDSNGEVVRIPSSPPRDRWHQSESRCLGPCSVPAGGGSVGTGSTPSAESPLSALPADCTPRTGKRTRSSPRLTTIRSGFTAYKTTPSTICWPTTNGAAGRPSTEISAVLDAAVIITPLTANLSSLVAACGVGPLSTTGAASIGVRRPEKERSLDFTLGPAAGAGDGSTCESEV